MGVPFQSSCVPQCVCVCVVVVVGGGGGGGGGGGRGGVTHARG